MPRPPRIPDTGDVAAIERIHRLAAAIRVPYTICGEPVNPKFIGCCYIVPGSDGTAKVGFTENPERRAREYRGHNQRFTHAFFGQTSVMRDLEKLSHKGLAEFRIKKTEWFRIDHFDLARIVGGISDHGGFQGVEFTSVVRAYLKAKQDFSEALTGLSTLYAMRKHMFAAAEEAFDDVVPEPTTNIPGLLRQPR